MGCKSCSRSTPLKVERLGSPQPMRRVRAIPIPIKSAVNSLKQSKIDKHRA